MNAASQDIQSESPHLVFGSVERRSNVTLSQLIHYLDTLTPVIIEGALEHCPARERWRSPTQLVDRVGDVLVPLTQLPSGPVRYYRDVPSVPTSFSECVRLIFGDNNTTYYVHEADLIARSPQLREDLVFPFPELNFTFQQPLFWIGSAGTVSRLHCDFSHNFIGQFAGRKRFRIFPHYQASHFYPPPPYAPDAFHMPVSTMGDTSLAEYPRFANARGLECVVEAGDVLILPSLWWHQVIGEEASVMVNWFGNDDAMARDLARWRAWLEPLYLKQWELAIERANTFEVEHIRDASLAATTRLLIEEGRADIARRALRSITEPGYTASMAPMFELGPATGGHAAL